MIISSSVTYFIVFVLKFEKLIDDSWVHSAGASISLLDDPVTSSPAGVGQSLAGKSRRSLPSDRSINRYTPIAQRYNSLGTLIAIMTIISS